MGLVPKFPTRISNPHLLIPLARFLDSLKLFPYDCAIKCQDMASTGREESHQSRDAVKGGVGVGGLPSLGTSSEWQKSKYNT